MAELGSSHPFLPKRIAALRNFVAAGSVAPVGRNPVAYALALFLGGGLAGAAGGIAALYMMVIMVGMLAAIAIPNFVAMQYRAKRAEVPANVDSIRMAELAYRERTGGWLPCGDAATALTLVDELPRDWAADPVAPCFAELGWAPEGRVRGAYWVEISPDGTDFVAHGISDVDGDDNPAWYAATSGTPAEMRTEATVY